METRDASPNVVYAIGYSSERTVQLHIFDTSTWTIVPSGAKALVGETDGAMLSYTSPLGVPDVSCSQQRFHSQENLTSHTRHKMVECPYWSVLLNQQERTSSETRLRLIVNTSAFGKI